MKNKYLKSIGVFIGGWIAAMIIFAALGNYDTLEVFLLNCIVPSIFLGFMGLILAFFQREERPKTKRIPVIAIILLLLIDQGLKYYLFSIDYQSLDIPIIEPSFFFNPVQNTHGSYLASLLNIQVPKIFYFILYIIVGFVLAKGYRFYASKKGNSIWLSSFVALFLSGILCVAIDNAYWGGSLDYIYIHPLYTFDIKDIYLTMGGLCLAIELWNEHLLFGNKISAEREKELMKEFKRFLISEKKIDE